MEKIGVKIRKLIKAGGFKTVKRFYEQLSEIYGESRMNRSTLTRLLKGHVEARERTLNQIAIILGVKTSFLREGTDAEVAASSPSEGVFTYNKKASLKILKRDAPFAVEKLLLKIDGKTADLQDDTAAATSLKWVHVLMGKINIVMQRPDGIVTQELHKSQSFEFDARQLHSFANASGSTSIALIIHYPVANSPFNLTARV